MLQTISHICIYHGLVYGLGLWLAGLACGLGPDEFGLAPTNYRFTVGSSF